jgi:uncharacterized protein (DUF2267 family)
MTATGPEVFDTTVQKTNAWLKAIMEELRWDDRQRAYLGLRAVLHALRDNLTVDEAAQLAAQLPMLVRGIYYEGWGPSRVPARDRDRATFLRRIEAAPERGDPTPDPERLARAVFSVLADHVSPGELEQVRPMLPRPLKALWPAPVTA